jgi:hypothetical protein
MSSYRNVENYVEEEKEERKGKESRRLREIMW